MDTVSAHDVVDELRRLVRDLGAVKKHKLLYYAQGWHLAVTGLPLFAEPVEAWANGPVVGSLWADEKHDRGRPAPRPLTGEQLASVEYAVRRYGGFTSREAIRLTHGEDPWRDASMSEHEDVLAERSPIIAESAMQQWFRADEAFQALTAGVERLRSRRDIYSFDRPADVPGMDEAIERALAGVRVRQVPVRSF